MSFCDFFFCLNGNLSSDVIEICITFWSYTARTCCVGQSGRCRASCCSWTVFGRGKCVRSFTYFDRTCWHFSWEGRAKLCQLWRRARASSSLLRTIYVPELLLMIISGSSVSCPGWSTVKSALPLSTGLGRRRPWAEWWFWWRNLAVRPMAMQTMSTEAETPLAMPSTDPKSVVSIMTGAEEENGATTEQKLFVIWRDTCMQAFRAAAAAAVMPPQWPRGKSSPQGTAILFQKEPKRFSGLPVPQSATPKWSAARLFCFLFSPLSQQRWPPHS